MSPEVQAAGVQTGTALLLQRLADFFPESEIKWKPQMVKGNRALALAYINSRAIMDRLDSVLGPDGWEDRYTVLPSGDVVCSLRVRIGERWLKKHDVGGPSEQPDAGDRMKAAFSDAFKRAAVKYGIGRYLARMPQQWHDYDPAKRTFASPPRVPAAFLPKPDNLSAERKPAAKPEQKPATTRPVIAGVERLLPLEVAKIAALCVRTGVDSESVARHYDVSRLDDLPADKLAEVVTRLEKKLPAGV